MTTSDEAAAPGSPVLATPALAASRGTVPVTVADLRRGGIGLGASLRIAFDSLLANKLRTLLTALGVIIGVMAVIALLAIGRGSQDAITAAITANGSNLLTVRPGASNQGGGIRGQVGDAQSLTSDDAAALTNPSNVPDATLVSPEYSSFAQLVAGAQNIGARITGGLAADR